MGGNEAVIEYMPDRIYKYFSVILAIIAVMEAIICMMCMFAGNDETASVFLLFICVLIILIALFNHLSKVKILFTQDAIYIQQNERQAQKIFYYKDYLYAYYCRDYKARLHLVLSKERLELKNLKKIVSNSSNFERTITSKCVVIFLENSKVRNNIKKVIGQRIKNVYDE